MVWLGGVSLPPMLSSTVCDILYIYCVGMYDIHGLQPDQDIQDIQYN